MRKLLILALSVISLTIMAQVPQGVGYQGVATDANGIELVNQSISIRASVLSGSATGTIEWEETHATSTDTFGLFTLTIGQGTNTTNGLQTSFADISWGTNTYFLKIEMDVTGGSTYSNMGTNQMMSVPYALYAESANINYDSISNFLSGDSTFITNVGSGMGGSGCDYSFPEGIEGQSIAWDLGVNGSYQDYTVPAGKNLFITNVHSDYSYSFRIDGIVVIDQAYSTTTASVSMLKHPICVKSGQVVSFDGPGGPNTFYGILTDAVVDPISFWFDDPGTGFDTYTVPVGKRLIVTNLWKSGIDGLYIDGVVIASGLFNYPQSASTDDKYLEIPLIVNSGSVLSVPNHYASFNGYLADENYFAGCGGGGSSSTSSLDSTTIANMIAAAGGGGCDIKFPEGLDGDDIVHDLHNNYTVPTGKNLYINHVYLNMNSFIIDTVMHVHGFVNYRKNSRNQANNSTFNIIAGEGQVLSSGNPGPGTASFTGFLVDITAVEPISYSLGGNSNGVISNPTYTVPSNKRLIINHFYNSNFDGSFFVDGIPIHYGQANNNAGGTHEIAFSQYTITVNGGSVVSIDHSNESSFNGYLVDENYFAACGGGGTSSTTTSSNSVGDFSYPDGKDNITPIIHDLSTSTYTVPASKNLYITSYWGVNSFDELNISSNTVFKGRGQYSNGQGAPVGLFELPIIVASSEIVSAPGKMNGFLVDASIAPINFSLSGNYVNNITYTVPAGKILVLLNFYSAMNGGYGSLQADGMMQLYGIFNYYDNTSCSPACESTNIKNPLFFDENTIISTEGWGDLQVINGYLMDK